MSDAPPRIRLGRFAPGSLAPMLYALVERGALKRPALAASLRVSVEVRFNDGFPPVRMTFADDGVLVEDADRLISGRPDLLVAGTLNQIIALIAAPFAGGLLSVASRLGRNALASVLRGDVRLEGDVACARRLVRLLAI